MVAMVPGPLLTKYLDGFYKQYFEWVAGKSFPNLIIYMPFPWDEKEVLE